METEEDILNRNLVIRILDQPWRRIQDSQHPGIDVAHGIEVEFYWVVLILEIRSSHEIGRGYPGRGLYLELEKGVCDHSPPSDNVIFDNQCYATTPSSSNGNSDPESSHYHGRQRHMHHQV